MTSLLLLLLPYCLKLVAGTYLLTDTACLPLFLNVTILLE